MVSLYPKSNKHLNKYMKEIDDVIDKDEIYLFYNVIPERNKGDVLKLVVGNTKFLKLWLKETENPMPLVVRSLNNIVYLCQNLFYGTKNQETIENI